RRWTAGGSTAVAERPPPGAAARSLPECRRGRGTPGASSGARRARRRPPRRLRGRSAGPPSVPYCLRLVRQLDHPPLEPAMILLQHLLRQAIGSRVGVARELAELRLDAPAGLRAPRTADAGLVVRSPNTWARTPTRSSARDTTTRRTAPRARGRGGARPPTSPA